MEYFIYDGKEQSGPFTFDQLKQKRISKNILIWREGPDDWIEAEKLPELNNIWDLKTPPIPRGGNIINSNQNPFLTSIKSHILENRGFYALYLFIVFILFSLALFCESSNGLYPFTNRCFGIKEFFVCSITILIICQQQEVLAKTQDGCNIWVWIK